MPEDFEGRTWGPMTEESKKAFRDRAAKFIEVTDNMRMPQIVEKLDEEMSKIMPKPGASTPVVTVESQAKYDELDNLRREISDVYSEED